jgi:hypothetical protein
LTVCEQQLPFNYDFFRKLAKYLRPKDLNRLAQVSNELRDWVVNTDAIWRGFSEREGIPCVFRAAPQLGAARMDYMTLRSRMISKVFFDTCLGQMIEAVPPISENDFNRLSQVNPFDPEKRTFCDTFKVLVDPTLLRRTDNAAVLQPLLENSWLDDEEALMIPLTLKNLKVLCAHPLQGAENGPVFSHFSDLVLDQRNVCPDKINVSFISERVAEETRGKNYLTQEKLLKERGFNVASLRHCILRDAAPILLTGTYADDECTYARNSDLIHVGNNVYHSVVGGFAPRSGVCVLTSYYVRDAYIAVVPCVPAEVLPALGP